MAKVAVLVDKEFQDMEVFYPYYRLIEAGHEPLFIGTGENSYKGKYGYPLNEVDANIQDVSADDFDAVVIPGGNAPAYLRKCQEVLDFVKAMNDSGKPIASICHGAWVLCSIEGFLKERKLTCFERIKDDVLDAGGDYSDEECIVDNNLITSRKPADLPAFMKALLEKLG